MSVPVKFWFLVAGLDRMAWNYSVIVTGISAGKTGTCLIPELHPVGVLQESFWK